MKRSLLFAVIAVISFPFVSSATTAAELQAQAQELLQQVAALQAQLAALSGAQQGGGTAPAAGAVCPQLGRTLHRGSSGADVSRLQQFLARDRTIYPEALVTGYYGSLTEAAVQRWQAQHHIVSSGSPETTGFGQVGPRTAAAMSLECSGSPGGAVAGTSGATVGGFVQVSPVSGPAPLSVTVVATVNTVGSCAGASYSLNWGDGTVPQTINVPAGTCGQLSQTYKHLYLYGGTYLVALSAGGHQTTATVIVSGASAPVTSGLPQETVSASPTSGKAPLEVTFSGTVTGADQGWCSGGCYSTLDFGDGSSGQVVLPRASNGVQPFSLKHTYSNNGTYTARLYQGAAGSGKPIVGSAMTIQVAVNPQSYEYGPLAVTPNVGGDPLVVTASFDLPSSCTGYSLAWGDSSASLGQNDGGSGCASGIVTKTFTHKYSGAGSYSIVLRRGASLERQDSVSLVISN